MSTCLSTELDSIRNTGVAVVVALVGIMGLAGAASAARGPVQADLPLIVPGLHAQARIVRDVNDVAHIQAHNEHDLLFLNGWVHAQDRLFQMDVSRRTASGTLAELLGPNALASDVQMRTLGLRRAAERSLPIMSPRAQAALQAYADGVNAYVSSHPLPPQYAAVEVSQFAPWTPVDSIVVGKLIAFGLSFDLDISPTLELQAYQAAGAAGGFDGSALYFDDLERSAPFDDAATVPDASVASTSAVEAGAHAARSSRAAASLAAGAVSPETVKLGKAYLAKVRNLAVFKGILDGDRRAGSNEWAVSGMVSAEGHPIIANDPHLSLGTPATFYPIGLDDGDIQAFGSSFPGAPFVILGYNRHISWGETTTGYDVTDTYQEQIVQDASSPSGLATVYQGIQEPVIPVPETFRANAPADGVLDDVSVVPPGNGIPAATLIVPRRNNGPIIQLDEASGAALSVQYTGFSGTRELESFMLINEARNEEEFVNALQYFDVGSQNFVYTDDAGNIGYFTSGEVPVREDLQAGTVNGLPPCFIRNGTGGNEWLPVEHPQPEQAVPYEILPYSEMPQVVNPAAGWFVNANNDPLGMTLDNDAFNQLRPGGGIYYLSYRFSGGFRAGRITEMIRDRLAGGGTISFADMQAMQADVTLRDAEVLTPFIEAAFANAQAADPGSALGELAADPGVAEAVERLAAWDFTTPTGIPEGYDAADVRGQLGVPSEQEIQNSIAATIYSAWRGQVIRNTIDATLAGQPLPGSTQALVALRHFLDNGGASTSGLDFFTGVPASAAGADLATRRDIVLLQSLRDGLDLLASPGFDAAFHGSTDQEDYRWGYLHRIVFSSVLGGPFDIPPAGGAFPAPFADLPGIPVQGGFNTVDAASHSARADTVNGFMFGGGPNRRFVSEHGGPSAPASGVRSESIWPGGVSETLGSPYYFNFLPLWLTNDTVPLLLTPGEVMPQAMRIVTLVPLPMHRP